MYLEYIVLNEVTQSQKENNTCCLSYEKSIKNIYVYIKKCTLVQYNIKRREQKLLNIKG